MIPITKLTIGKEEKKALKKVLDSGKLAYGPKALELENLFTKYCNAKYAVATNNGTSALHTALYAIGIRPEDEVITTPFTFIATANSILMVGAKPVFVDIDERTFNIDHNKLEKVITKKTKAIIAVNLYGQPADYTEIKQIARKHNLLIIEDAAQSINAIYKNKKSGNLADISCFSFYATKNIMCGEGGIITTNNKKFYEKAKLFRNHGQDEKKRYFYHDLGYNYRMSDLQATILLEQLKRIQEITEKRQKNAEKYNKALKNIKGIIIPFKDKDRTHVYHQYTLKITGSFKLSRNEFKNYLEKKGIQSNIYYPKPLFNFKHLIKKPIKYSNFPITCKVVNEVISIPVHPLLKSKEIKYIIKTIKEI